MNITTPSTVPAAQTTPPNAEIVELVEHMQELCGRAMADQVPLAAQATHASHTAIAWH